MKTPVRMANQILANGIPTKTARCTGMITRNPIHMAMGIHTITDTTMGTVTHMTTTIITILTTTLMTTDTITHTAHNMP